METVTLNNGVKMPVIGLGTYLSTNHSCYEAVETAIKNGYRMIDTACAYGNHKEVGAAMKKCIDEGIIKREDMFITTKIWICDWKPENVEKAMQVALEELGTSYVDLLLIHYPPFFNLEPQDEKHRQEGYFFDYPVVPSEHAEKLGFDIDRVMITWRKMEELVQRGLVRALGVSNYSSVRLQMLCDRATIKPTVNQVELHPYLQQWELKEVCDRNGVYLEAYFPLGGLVNGRIRKYDTPLVDPIILRIADSHKKTPAQVMLRWAIQRGTIVIPKSVHASRVIENIQVFDFALSDAEMKEMRDLDKRYRFNNRTFLWPEPADGEMMWNGEYVN